MKLSLGCTSETGCHAGAKRHGIPGQDVSASLAFTPDESRQSLPPYLHRHTGIRNEVTAYVLSDLGRQNGVGANRKASAEGWSQKQTPLGNRKDTPTDSRLMEL